MSGATGVGEMLLSLTLVIGLIFGLAWLLRRMQGLRGSRAGALQVHAGIAVGAKERVLWIEAAGGEHLLVGVTPAGISLLHRYEQPPAIAAAAPSPDAAGSFAAQLAEALGRRPS